MNQSGIYLFNVSHKPKILIFLIACFMSSFACDDGDAVFTGNSHRFMPFQIKTGYQVFVYTTTEGHFNITDCFEIGFPVATDKVACDANGVEETLNFYTSTVNDDDIVV